MDNIIITGCSYSAKSGVDEPYSYFLKKYFNVNVLNLAWPGQSNDTIIRNVKEEVKKGIKNTLFICQITHLHRISKFCTINKKWLDFQPAIINELPSIKDDKVQFEVLIYDSNNKNISRHNTGGIGIYGIKNMSEFPSVEKIYNKLLDWYETYLMYLYDEENTFYELHDKLEELTKQVKDSGNDIIYLYWPDINYNSSLFNNNFVSIEGEYSILKWSIKNKLTQNTDTHLSMNGHKQLSKIIVKHIDKNINLNEELI